VTDTVDRLAAVNRLIAAYNAAVEALEPGASRHCCRTVRDHETGVPVAMEHPRLGVRVTIAL